MAQTLVLELPQDAWDQLVQTAAQKGLEPSSVACEMLTDSLTDPVMKLAGCLSAPISDVSERHDEYLGVGLLHSDK